MLKGRRRYRELEEALGHKFRSQDLLERALTHSSVGGPGATVGQSRRSKQKDRKFGDNERLEFIGDRVLGLAVAELLGERFPEASEGELARRFNRLVCGDACAQVARDMALGGAMVLSDSEAAGGGRDRDTILADAMEAVLAAVFLDAGFDKARTVVRRLWAPYTDALPANAMDAKTALQEWAQGEGLPLPRYVEVKRTGPDHAPHFTTEVQIEDHAAERGQGSSKRIAEQAAATAFLQREKIWDAAETSHVD